MPLSNPEVMNVYTYKHMPQFRKMSQHNSLYANIKNVIAWCTAARVSNTAEKGKQQSYMMSMGIHFSGSRFFVGVVVVFCLFLLWVRLDPSS